MRVRLRVWGGYVTHKLGLHVPGIAGRMVVTVLELQAVVVFNRRNFASGNLDH